MPFEDELSGELRRAGESFELADRTALLDGAVEIGRRGVRRRRIAAVTGGALALALVVVGGGMATGALGGSGSAAELASGTHSGTPGAVPGSGVLGSEMVETLASLLPGGKVTGGAGVGTGDVEDEVVASAAVVYDDGGGEATVTASLYPTPGSLPGKARVSPCTDGAGDTEEAPGGAVLVYDAVDSSALTGSGGEGANDADCTTTESLTASEGNSLVGYRFRTLTADGITVDVRAYSGVLDDSPERVRSNPPLARRQLTALARSEKWADLVRRLEKLVAERHDGPAGATAGASPTPSPAPPLDYSTLMPTFLKLLPDDVTVVRSTHAAGEEYAEVVVDDGQGESLVGINVQRDMRDVAGELYGSAETLPDGTLLAVSQGAGEKGGAGVVQWTVDSMRPDGMRVVVMAFNAAQQSAAATRAEPALSVEELTALVTSPEWLKLRAKK
ncbi:hypothetical protein [Streptomyces sp. AM 2-1-1]|uniref:hypothetical protein n=1 Tax=Streptomyces sp. AM 2-1-1 TaxID=3028709 RepID=UPI0023BA0D1A|nr:hypothetical protein [Streptomyces sp. AM 2-1-1]WEH40458.1 hypothetical protein PZB77_13585 [Streptomyces sp. AM 2-1-1]